MSSISFKSFQIKRFRSLMDITIPIDENKPVVICGENNIGKTNVLRALNLFFNHISNENLFNPAIDLPNHIFAGSRGAGSKVDLIGTFLLDKKTKKLAVTFFDNGKITYTIQGKSVTQEDAQSLLKDFQFFLVESHNVNHPDLISEALESVLAPLDKKRSKQSDPLDKLKEFIESSQRAINDLEKDINQNFHQMTNFDGILKGKKIKISFAEFDRLRDAIKRMASISLSDGNNLAISTKGSGAQRAIFLSLMQYISGNSKKHVIWGIDEPEAFLQPRLQKKVSETLCNVVKDKKQPVILTTHSHHFIDLNHLKSVHLFSATQEKKEYERQPGKVFYQTNVAVLNTNSIFEKALKIKEHLGVENNDGWEIMPINIVVEGSSDRKYLGKLFEAIGLPKQNIIDAGGATKIGGHLQYYESLAKNISFKPYFTCVFDHDKEGKESSSRVSEKSYKNIAITKVFIQKFNDLDQQNDPNISWEIEDFIPQKIIFKVINQILKSENYKPIQLRQINSKNDLAHRSTGIFEYAMTCTNLNNPKLPSLDLRSTKYKYLICRNFCEIVDIEIIYNELNSSQISFLKSLIEPPKN